MLTEDEKHIINESLRDSATYTEVEFNVMKVLKTDDEITSIFKEKGKKHALIANKIDLLNEFYKLRNITLNP